MMRKPAILLVGTFFSQKGHKSVGEDLADHLRERGWQIITTSAKVERIPRFLDILSSIWNRRNHYQVAQIDVYSGLAFMWAEAAGWLLKRLNKPFVLTLHGGELPEFADRWPKRVGRLLHAAQAVTTPSNYLLEEMKSFRQDIHLLPNPLEIGSYPFRLRTKPKPDLVWLRAFHQIYNPMLAPHCLELLLTKFPDASMTMVGPDKDDGSFQETKRVAAALGVQDHICFPGGVPKAEVSNWLNKGDIFLNTTNIDNTPVSVMEAMACGLCVVSTNVGGIPYLLEDEQDALLVPPDDPQAMAEALKRVMTEPNLSERLSRNARKKVAKFDWENIVPEWEMILRQTSERQNG